MAKTGRGRASKQEVVEVYTEALAKQAEASIPDAKEEKKRADDIKLRDAAGTSSVETIVQNLASLRIGILKTLDGLGEQLVGEQKHLSQLTGAVELERQTLEELYGIKAEAGTLTALLSAQKEKQEAERKRVEAQGIADYQKILSTGLSDKQLQYEMIKAISTSPNAKLIIIDTKKSAPFIIDTK